MIEDRLFKIRHCMDIEGVVRPLALFEPPIDPALLVRAVAAGLDIQSVLADLAAPPRHRFAQLDQKAIEFCGRSGRLARGCSWRSRSRTARRWRRCVRRTR
jgi:hypothetical protein